MEDNVLNPTAAESDTPTAGENAGDLDQTAASNEQPNDQPAAQPQGQNVRYFTQDDVNRIVQERLAREQRKYEERIRQLTEAVSQYEALVSEYMDMAERLQNGTLVEQASAPMPPEWGTYKEIIEDLYLDREINRLAAKYSDFKENEAEILQLALKHKLDDLELAYKIWKADRLDVDAIKKQAVEEYLNQKRQAASTPTPQGPGGGVPSSGRKPKNLDEATEAALNRLKHADTG